jgi:hypothetical protein
LWYTLLVKNTKPQPRREVVLTCRVEGKEVSLEELARELVRCGGIVRRGGRKDGH